MKKILMLSFLFFLAVGCSKTEPILSNQPTRISDAKNTTYTIEGQAVTLLNGKAESQEQANSASAVKTQVFDASTEGDVNGDGLADTAVILTQDRGGSGVFYYVAVAIKTSDGYKGSNAIFLGDRIAPQNNQIQNNIVVVNYADRKTGEAFGLQPSVGKSLFLEYFNNVLVSQPEALQVSSPFPYQQVLSPLIITGQARGTWFFEASFPVVLQDENGKTIAQGTAQAKTDWMTENFVSFIANLTFTNPAVGSKGVLVLKKDNPSGLSQNESSYEIPVVFK